MPQAEDVAMRVSERAKRMRASIDSLVNTSQHKILRPKLGKNERAGEYGAKRDPFYIRSLRSSMIHMLASPKYPCCKWRHTWPSWDQSIARIGQHYRFPTTIPPADPRPYRRRPLPSSSSSFWRWRSAGLHCNTWTWEEHVVLPTL